MVLESILLTIRIIQTAMLIIQIFRYISSLNNKYNQHTEHKAVDYLAQAIKAISMVNLKCHTSKTMDYRLIKTSQLNNKKGKQSKCS